MGDKVFVDTNVLLRFSFPGLHHHEECEAYLLRLMRDNVQLWISGHVHDPYDCMVGATRCLANPCGYPGAAPETEGFRADRVVEVVSP